MRFFGNTSSQRLELSRCWWIVVSSSESGCTRNGTNTGKIWRRVPFTIGTGSAEVAAYLWVNNHNALFTLSSMASGWLATGSSNLSQTTLGQRQRSFPPVDRFTAASVFPFASKFWRLQLESVSVNQSVEITYFQGRVVVFRPVCFPSDESTTDISVISYSIHFRRNNIVTLYLVFPFGYIGA